MATLRDNIGGGRREAWFLKDQFSFHNVKRCADLIGPDNKGRLNRV